MDEESAYRLALCYALGKGIEKNLEKARALCREAWPKDLIGKEGIKNDFYNAPNDLFDVLCDLKDVIGDKETEKQLQELMEYLKTTPVKK